MKASKRYELRCCRPGSLRPLAFWEVLRYYRAFHGITNEMMALVLEVSEGTVSMWMSGRARPRHRLMEEGAVARLQDLVPVEIAEYQEHVADLEYIEDNRPRDLMNNPYDL